MATNRLLLIGGKLVFAEGRKVAEVINPATGAAFASVPEASREDLHLAIRAAKEAFKSWKKTSFQERANCLVSFADKLQSRRDEFAKALTQEQGKPLALATGEVDGVIRQCFRLAKEDHLKPELVSSNKHGRVELHYVPRGVVGAITPWNFPMAMAANKMFPSVITGNTVVIKPSPYTL